MAIDSTGLKIFGEGEWKVKVHGKSKRRTWCKLHICIDVNTQNILSLVLTKANIHDATMIGEVVPEKVNQVLADGIYDTFGVYDSLIANKSQPVIPPRKNAAIKNKDDFATVARNDHIRGILQQSLVLLEIAVANSAKLTVLVTKIAIMKFTKHTNLALFPCIQRPRMASNSLCFILQSFAWSQEL